MNKMFRRLITKHSLVLIILLLFVSFLAGIMIQKYFPLGKLWQEITKGDSVLMLRNDKNTKGIYLNTRSLNGEYKYGIRQLKLDEIALVLVDVWESHPDKNWEYRTKEHISSKMVPLINLARDYKMNIIHAPYYRKVAKEVGFLSGEAIINFDNSLEFDRYLKKHNISTLLYAGYALNRCIINRPVGIIEMSKLGYNVILIRDCTLAINSTESLDGRQIAEVVIDIVEALWGETTTLKDLHTALEGK